MAAVRTVEICAHLDVDGFRDCERIGCEEHDGPTVMEEIEPMDSFTWDDVEIEQ